MSKIEPEEEALIYQSQKILGKLYRAIRLSSREEDNQILKEAPALDPLYIPAGENDHVLMALIEQFEACGLDSSRQENDAMDREQAWYAMHTYASDLRHIAWSNTMNAGHPLSEHEVFIGTILHGVLATKTKQDLITRVNLQCKELIDAVLIRLEGPDGAERPQLWANRILAALRVAVSQAGNFGAQTFGAVAVKSALSLLLLMKDVRRSDIVLSNNDFGEEQPFEPIISNLTSGLGLTENLTEGSFFSPEATALGGTVVLQEDLGGETVFWDNEITVETD